MKIALSFPAFDRRGGVERVLVDVSLGLARRGHDVHVFCRTADPAIASEQVTVHSVKCLAAPAFMALGSFQRACMQEMRSCGLQFDAFGSFGVQSPGGGVVWTTSVHREWLRIAASQRRGWQRLRQRLNPFHPAVLRLERQLYAGRRYSHVIALTERVARELQDHYGVPRSDTTVLANGYSRQQFNTDGRASRRCAAREELGLRPTDRVAVFVANELHRKGYLPLLDALRRLPEPRPHLLVVGRVSRTEAVSAAERAGLASRVHVLGPRDDVARLFCAADVFILPTQYEAWGLVVVESLACGTPVVVSRCAGAAIVVRPGVTGELIDDPNDPSEIARLVQAVLSRGDADPSVLEASVASLEWSSVIETYERLLAAHRPRRDAHASQVAPSQVT